MAPGSLLTLTLVLATLGTACWLVVKRSRAHRPNREGAPPLEIVTLFAAALCMIAALGSFGMLLRAVLATL